MQAFFSFLSSKHHLITLGVFVLLLGAGCSKPEPISPLQPTTSTPEIEQLVAMTPDQEAYAYCVIQDYTIKINMRQENRPQQILCQFDDGSACSADAFLADTCKPGEYFPDTTPEEILPVDGEIFGGRYCEPIADPVCGRDGRTYTNGCIAELSGQPSFSPGSCPDNGTTDIAIGGVIPSDSTDVNENNQASTSNPANTSSQESPTQNNSGNVVSTIKSSLSPDSQISQCPINNTNYYLVRTSCPECVSLLYSANGSLLCYPDHDISGKCPAGFQNSRPSSCRIL